MSNGIWKEEQLKSRVGDLLIRAHNLSYDHKTHDGRALGELLQDFIGIQGPLPEREKQLRLKIHELRHGAWALCYDRRTHDPKVLADLLQAFVERKDPVTSRRKQAKQELWRERDFPMRSSTVSLGFFMSSIPRENSGA